MKKLFLLIFVGMFLITLVSSQSFIFAQNEVVNQTFYCYDSNNNLCTSGNVGVVNVFKNGIAYSSNDTLIYNTTDWRYILPTSELGDYSVLFTFIGPSSSGTGEFTYLITPSGKVSSTGESILYFVIVLIMFGLNGILFYFILVLPYRNERDEEGNVAAIVKLKYLKILFIAIFYPFITILLNLINGLANQFTSFSIFSGQIGFIEELMIRLLWPFYIIIVAWVIVLLIKDTNARKIINEMNLGV